MGHWQAPDPHKYKTPAQKFFFFFLFLFFLLFFVFYFVLVFFSGPQKRKEFQGLQANANYFFTPAAMLLASLCYDPNTNEIPPNPELAK